MEQNKFAEARKLMSQTLKKDKGLYMSYQANIAMKLYDNKPNICNIKACNTMAKKLIKLIFD